MNAPIQQLAISLGVMQVARKIPFDDPEVLQYVRIGYVVSQLVILATYFYVSYKVKAKNDQTVLKYVDAPNPMTQEPGQLVTTTVRDYDLSETSKLIRSAYTSIAMMAFLHLYMKYTQPLFVQAIMGLKGIYDAKTVKLHILGQPAEGDLKRPFKAAPGLFGGATGPQTDKAAIDEAEKRIGAKKDE
ncbi:inorganic phosphate transporter [Dentipellis sp. KUC8613]|nr:inorganic phosphate transporter [Dentipellis sp. KUC8613]